LFQARPTKRAVSVEKSTPGRALPRSWILSYGQHTPAGLLFTSTAQPYATFNSNI